MGFTVSAKMPPYLNKRKLAVRCGLGGAGCDEAWSLSNYRDVNMAVRWTAAGFLEAEKAFRRLRGGIIPALIHALQPTMLQSPKAA